MKHEWTSKLLDCYGKPVRGRCVMQHAWRVCEVCGAKQMYDRDYDWGRVIGWRWIPLVGRCQGKVKQ